MQTQTIQELVDSKPISKFQFRTFLLCGLIVLLDGFDTLAIGYVAPYLTKEWGLTRAALGPVFASGLFGLMVGALAFGPAADRWGRRPVLIASTVVFAVFSLATAFTTDIQGMVAMRFLTGLGLGGAMPNAIALTAEYAPARARSTAITVMFCGFSLGGAIGGILALKLINAYGWQAVFIAGGVAPLVLSVWLLFSLPESMRFLVMQGGKDGRIALLMTQMGHPPQEGGWRAAPEPVAAGSPVTALFKDGRARLTILLWVMYFASLLEIFFLSNWMPTVFSGLGMPLQQALMATTMLAIGGTLGTLVLGAMMDRLSRYKVIAVSYALAALLVASLGLAGVANAGLIMVIAFFAGFFCVGAQVGSNALAAQAYPTSIRATGVGWALGVGRIGSLVSAFGAGSLLLLDLGPFQIFLIAAVPIAIASAAAAALRRGQGEQ